MHAISAVHDCGRRPEFRRTASPARRSQRNEAVLRRIICTRRKPPKISETEQQQLLQRHLAYLRSQAEKGKYRLAGPFLDGEFAGILIIDAATAEEAKEIVDHDPMVLAGRLAIQVHPAMLADVSCVLIEYEEHGGK